MGYTTDFEGSVTVEPPLNPHEVAYLRKFARTRRMSRRNGPYYVEGSGYFGQGHDQDVIDYNRPDESQPSLWCDWEPNDEGTEIRWNGTEKFYESTRWMLYLVGHFLMPGAVVHDLMAIAMDQPVAEQALLVGAAEFEHFTFDHDVNGTITAQGEDPSDQWRLVVTHNIVAREEGH